MSCRLQFFASCKAGRVYDVGMYDAFVRELRTLADPAKAAFFPRFFKAGKGEYAEGDKFLGVTVPGVRSVVKRYASMSLEDVRRLLNDPLHELRLAGVLLLVSKFEHGKADEKKTIVDFYLANLKSVNNWDLVDASASKILGAYLLNAGDVALLYKLAASDHLWTQRVAMVATYAFIRSGNLQHTFKIAELLLGHTHDLMHKASGWMLREAGKRDREALENFLAKHAAVMPRTMLRYAVEKLEEGRKKVFMGMKKKRVV